MDNKSDICEHVDAMIALTDSVQGLIGESDFSANKKAKLRADLATIKYRTSTLRDSVNEEPEVHTDGAVS